MLDPLGAVQSRFVYGTRSHVPDYMVRGGATYRLVSDDKGSVRLVVDVATGVVAQAIEYDPWGVVLADTSPGFQPFGYAGGLYDADTGLVRFGERDYDAFAGRWTSKDPIGFAGGDPNLYAYVGGDPVNRIDPSGLVGEPGWDELYFGGAQPGGSDFLDDVAASVGWGLGAFNDSWAGQALIGFGDGVGFGLAAFIRDRVTGGSEVVDRCSTAYAVANVVGGVAGSIALPGGALRGLALAQRSVPFLRVLDRGRYVRVGMGRNGGPLVPMLRFGRSPGNQFYWWGHWRL